MGGAPILTDDEVTIIRHYVQSVRRGSFGDVQPYSPVDMIERLLASYEALRSQVDALTKERDSWRREAIHWSSRPQEEAARTRAAEAEAASLREVVSTVVAGMDRCHDEERLPTLDELIEWDECLRGVRVVRSRPI
jgi:transposase